MNRLFLKKFWLGFTLLFIMLNCGCWDLREINQIAVPLVLGVDIDKQSKIGVSALIVDPKSSSGSTGGQMSTIIVSGSDYSVAMAARRSMLTISRTPDWSQAQSMILGQNVCENSLPSIMDFMSRNRNVVPNMILLIARDSRPENIMENINSTGKGLKLLLLNNEYQLGMYVPVTKADFNYAMMTPGIEAAVPMVSLKEVKSAASAGGDKNNKNENNKSKRIVLSGTAVFKSGKMVGTLNETESKGYRWLKSKTKTGGFLVIQSPVHNHMDVALEITRFSSSVKPKIKNGNLSMQIDIKTELAFYEDACTGEILTSEMQSRLKKKTNQEIERQVRSCITKIQALNSDILGWGELLQEHQPGVWETLGPDWDATFPSIDYDIKIETNIVHTYLSKKSFEIR